MKTKALAWIGFLSAAGAAVVWLDPPRAPAPRAEAVVAAPSLDAAPPRRKPRPKRDRSSTAANPASAPRADEELLDAALDEQLAAEERAAALDALDAAAVEESQVARLSLLAQGSEVPAAVRQAALETLLAIAEDGSEPARLRALQLFALAEHADPEEESELASLLHDDDAAVRMAAAGALGEAAGASRDEALHDLEDALSAEANQSVQEAIGFAIVRLAPDRRGVLTRPTPTR